MSILSSEQMDAPGAEGLPQGVPADDGRLGSILEQELQQQREFFEELYRVTVQQCQLLQAGLFEQLIPAKLEKDRLLLTIRDHTQRLSELHASWVSSQGLASAETQDRIAEKVRGLRKLVHRILDIEKENSSLACNTRDRARIRLKKHLPVDKPQSRPSGEDRKSAQESDNG